MNDFIKKYKFIIISIFILVVVLIGGTYAWININVFGEKVHRVQGGMLSLTLDESTCTEINLDSTLPLSDEEGMKLVSCDFSLSNDSADSVEYVVYLDDADLESGEVRMDDDHIKYGIQKNSENPQIELLSDAGVNPNREISRGLLEVDGIDTFKLRLWIDYNASEEAIGKVAATKIRVVADLYRDTGCLDIPNYGGVANPPELIDGMISVTYDGVNWVKADTANISNSWYDYDEQEWANAVTVTETNRASLISSPVGTVIPMEDINSMMVWIPRYSYTIKDTYGVQGCGGSIPSVNTPGAIDIKFVSENVTDLGTAAYTGDTAEEWFTNSAFCFGTSCDNSATRNNMANEELSGFWVAKFETSTIDTTCLVSMTSDNCNKVLPLISKPSLKTLREINYLNFYKSIDFYYNESSNANYFGLNDSEYDAHILKNTEWGAVAYLSQSKYGKYGNEDYTGSEKEVAINNCNLFITGIAGDTVGASSSSDSCSTNFYDTTIGQTASTTGNIFGIYDMSGGASEYVMGVISNSTNVPYAGSSGFTSLPSENYYNIYKTGSSTSLGNFYLGDATTETNDWYGDYISYPTASLSPWLSRGKLTSNSRGIFDISNGSGQVSRSQTFRIAITP